MFKVKTMTWSTFNELYIKQYILYTEQYNIYCIQYTVLGNINCIFLNSSGKFLHCISRIIWSIKTRFSSLLCTSSIIQTKNSERLFFYSIEKLFKFIKNIILGLPDIHRTHCMLFLILKSRFLIFKSCFP